ncbi:MAG TPA: hypothetical protein VEB22_05020 [Phycisphaerales bacterium]|nr:hypothetical protein [Phycisphaerales bacterium]
MDVIQNSEKRALAPVGRGRGTLPGHGAGLRLWLFAAPLLLMLLFTGYFLVHAMTGAAPAPDWVYATGFGVPLFVAVACLAIQRLALRSRRRRLRSHEYMLCPGCEYPLPVGAASGLCPECGRPFERGEVITTWKNARM